MGYFHTSKLLKLAFLSSLKRKYMLWKGFYHDFSTKNASASGALPPGPPPGALPPGPPRFLAPLTIFPGAISKLSILFLKLSISILKQIVWETQEWHWNFSRPSDSWVIDQNIILHVLFQVYHYSYAVTDWLN